MDTELKIGDMTFTAVVVGSKTSEKLPIDNFGLIERPYCDMDEYCEFCFNDQCIVIPYNKCPHFLAMKRIEDLEYTIDLYIYDQDEDDYDW